MGEKEMIVPDSYFEDEIESSNGNKEQWQKSSEEVDVSFDDVKRTKGISKRKTQKYRKAWELFPEFEVWLEPDPKNVYKAQCKMCCRALVADISVLKMHASTRRHLAVMSEFERASKTLKTLTSGKYGGATSVKMTEAVVDNSLTEGVQMEDLMLSDQGDVSAREESLNESGGENNSRPMALLHRYKPIQEPPTYTTKAIVTQKAPNWKATAIVNGHVTRLELADYKGRYLILFFYPQDFSLICPTELLALSDRVQEFRQLKTEIVACSVDSHLTHLAWVRTTRADGGLANPKIPLLADPTHVIARDYGVLLPELGHTLRAHFIIDRLGILRHMTVNDIGVGRGIDELIRLVQAFQHADETESSCPVDWKPGVDTV